jgi:HlyD family secretion protein
MMLVAAVGCGSAGYFVAQSKDVRDWVVSMRPGEKPTEVRLAKANRGDLVKTVNAPGSLEPRTKVQISAQVAARVTALPFDEGQTVRTGDVVVRLDGREFSAILESAQASMRSEEARLEGARASLARAEAELKRQRELARTGDAARTILETAESDFLRAKSTVDASTHAIGVARANIARAQKDLDNCEIQASFDGVVVKRNVEVGELVVVGTFNNPGSVILEIADLSVMVLKARVDEANIAPVKAGQKARVFINAYRGREFSGKVDKVGLKRIVDRDGTGYYEVEILVEKGQDDLLRSGLTANTDIEVETLYQVIKVPSQAILDRRIDELPKPLLDNPLVDKTKSFARVVYVIEDGKAKAVPVAVGSSDLTHSIITAGLEEGAAVVSGPFKVLTELKDGRRLIEEGTKPEAAPPAAAGAAGTTPPGEAPAPKPSAKAAG